MKKCPTSSCELSSVEYKEYSCNVFKLIEYATKTKKELDESLNWWNNAEE